MSHNYYSEIYLHLVWHTKNSLPLLTERVQQLAYQALQKRILETPGVLLHAIGGIENHVHLAVSVPPTLLLSEWIGKLKGGTTHDVNQAVEENSKVLQWQAGYGVVGFGKKDLPWVIEYIRNQREHHRRGSATPRLEQIATPDQ